MQTVAAIASLLAWLGLLAYRIGASRSKNSVSTATRAVCGVIVAVLAFWAVGEALLFQHANGIIGLRYDVLLGWRAAPAALVFPLAALALAAGIAEAALTERGTFAAAMVTTAAIALAILPIGWFWAWHGWLHDLGFIDDAGASWLHLSAAVWGGVGAWMLGSRAGKYNKDGSINAIPGHNIPLAAIGIGLMLIGQLFIVAAAPLLVDRGFPGEFGGKIGGTILAAAGGGAAGMMITLWRYGKPDIMVVLGSFLGGAIATAAGNFSPPAAILVGFIAGCLIPMAAAMLDLRRIVDDPTGGITLHGIAGAWGTLAAGIFTAGSASHRLQSVGIQLLGLLAIGGGSAIAAFLTFAVLRAMGRLRIREADEIEGLDLAEHDIAAYPDFQQNTIRSYHLREA
jgi:ammonium transporter, Amt family